MPGYVDLFVTRTTDPILANSLVSVGWNCLWNDSHASCFVNPPVGGSEVYTVSLGIPYTAETVFWIGCSRPGIMDIDTRYRGIAVGFSSSAVIPAVFWVESAPGYDQGGLFWTWDSNQFQVFGSNSFIDVSLS